MQFGLDIFAVFDGHLSIAGWVLGDAPVVRLELASSGVASGRQWLASYGSLDSPDIAANLGPGAARVRFAERFPFSPTADALNGSALHVTLEGGLTEVLSGLVGRQPNPAAALAEQFVQHLHQATPGRLLEVGARARSGVTRRNILPPAWGYTGMDIMEGPNVDIVGDAHEADALFPRGTFQAVMAYSVLEHLLMPWKAVLALNRVLSVGAVGLFTTHQCWPMHDQPWDFWRFSAQAWDGLLNRATGFEIIEAAMGEPAFVVPRYCHAVTNFGTLPAYMASSVLFRKTGDTFLSWPVSIADAVATQYPAGNL